MSPNAQVLDSPVFETLPIVEAELSYLIPMVEKPVNYTYEPWFFILNNSRLYCGMRLKKKNASYQYFSYFSTKNDSLQ